MAPAGETLGKYRILSTLGHGGMGEVFLAALQGPAGFNKLVVVKAMRASVAGDERYKKMLLDEARLAARLRHPNVVQTIEVAEVEGRPLIAMEYLEGQPLNLIVLAVRKSGERLPTALAARIVCDVLSGLYYAHELKDFDGKPLGIVHRDVTPHNIFVTYDGEVKLLDFGIAKATTNVEETELGMVKGKVAYMAPEQAQGAPLDCRTDLFAIGLVLWELVTSRRLLQGDSQAAVLNSLLNKPLTRAVEIDPKLDPALSAILDRALQRSADDRYQTAQEMRQALLPFARNVDREELGQRVSALFKEERLALAQLVETGMRPADDGSTKTIRAVSLIPESGDGGSAVTSKNPARQEPERTGSLSQSQTPPANTVPTLPQEPSRPRRVWPWAALAGCVAVAGVVAWVTKSGSASAPAGVAIPATALATTAHVDPSAIAPAIRPETSATPSPSLGAEAAPGQTAGAAAGSSSAASAKHPPATVTVRPRSSAAPADPNLDIRMQR